MEKNEVFLNITMENIYIRTTKPPIEKIVTKFMTRCKKKPECERKANVPEIENVSILA